MEEQNLTPQISELEVKASGNPLQMRGLCRVISNCYSEGMPLNELQMAVATTVQEQLQKYLQALEPEKAQLVMEFLQNLDYTLTLENNKVIRK